jgi:hypothetical protein
MKDLYNAWLDPQGKFHEVGYMQHSAWAQEYFNEKYGYFEALEKVKELCESELSSYPHVALHNLGWLRLLTWSDGKTKLLGNCYDPKVKDDTVDPSMNMSQKKTMKEWCRTNGYCFENLFKD